MDSSGKRGAVEDSPGAQSHGAAHSLGAGTGAEGSMDSSLQQKCCKPRPFLVPLRCLSFTLQQD